MKPEVLLIAGGAVIAAFAWAKLSEPGGAQDIGKSVATAMVDMATGVLTGTVVAVGETAGIPETDVQKARAAMNEFDRAPWYEQATISFKVASYSTASEYLKWLWDRSYRP